MSKKRSIFLLMLLIALLVSIIWGQIPQTISYQGVLTDVKGKPVADGTYNLTFKLYLTATGSELVWSEKQTLTLTSGIFNAILGKVTPLNLPFNVPYWLGITVDTGDELVPRIELTAAAYSLNANSVADSVINGGKITKGTVVRSVNNLTDHLTLKAGPNVTITSDQHTITISAVVAGGNTLDQAYDQGGAGAGRTIAADAGAVNITGPDGLLVNGKLGIGTTTPAQKLDVAGTAQMTGFQLPTGAAENYVLTSDASGVGLWKAITIPASGWTLSGNNAYSSVSGNIGIGNPNPVYKLDVTGTAQLTGFRMPTGATNNYVLTSDASGVGTWKAVTVPTTGWTIAGNNVNTSVTGNVGIGNTNPTQKLDVTGTAKMTGFQLATGAAENYVLTSDASGVGAWKSISIPASGWTIAGNNVYSSVTGNIGIGNTNPMQKLDVTGIAQMTGFKMPTGAANNYVLTSNASGVGTWKAITIPATGWTINGNNVYSSVTGNVGIGNTNPTQKLDVTGIAQVTGFKMPTGATNNYVLTSDATGTGTWKALPPSTGMSGSGTLNYLPKFTGSSSVGNSLLFENAGKIGLGTTDPLANLHINAGSDTLTHLSISSLHGRPAFEILRDAQNWGKVAMRMFVDGSSNGIINVTNKKSGAAVGLKIQTNGIERFMINNTGNVGIGTIAPVEKLDIAGTAQMTGFKMPTGASDKYVLTSDANGVGTWKALPTPSTGITGSGTMNYIPKFSGATSIGNSIIYENNGLIGIGTTAPTRELHIEKAAASGNHVAFKVKNSGPGGEEITIAAGNTGVPGIRFFDGTRDVMTFRNGMVGIGTVTPSQESKLHVSMNGGAGNQFRIENTYTPGNILSIGIGNTNMLNHQVWIGAPYGTEGKNTFAYGMVLGLNSQTEFVQQLRYNNINLMTVKTDGKVGIGTVTPAAALDVVGTAQMTGFKMPTGAVNNYILTSDANGVGTWKALPIPSTGITGSGTTNYIPLFTGSTSIGNSIVFQNNNRIGIGTATPVVQFHVRDALYVGSYISPAFTSQNSTIYLGHSQKFISQTSGITVNGTNDWITFGQHPGARGWIWGLSATDNAPHSGITPLMALLASGNLGIGTNNPVQKLDVAGTAQMTGFKMPTGAANNYVLTSDANGVGTWKLATAGGWTINGNNMYSTVSGNVGIGTSNPYRPLHIANATNVSLVLEDLGAAANARKKFINADDGLLRFGKFDDNWNFTSQMTIDNNGYVGIGTENPAQKFVVAGNTQINGDIIIQDEKELKNTSGTHKIKMSAYAGGIMMSSTSEFHINYDTNNDHADHFIVQGPGSYNALIADGTGDIGIGTGINDATNILTIKRNSATDPIADAWTTYSSRRWKTNIQPINNALEYIKQLQGVRFDWKETGKSDIGLIAEDVGKVVPEVVAYEENGVDAQSVDYARLVSVLIEGMKEQQKVIEQQQKKLDDLIQKFNQLGK